MSELEERKVWEAYLEDFIAYIEAGDFSEPFLSGEERLRLAQLQYPLCTFPDLERKVDKWMTICFHKGNALLSRPTACDP